MINRPALERFSVGLLVSVCIVGAINWADFTRAEGIADGRYVHGFPLSVYRHGGFEHEHRMIWSGLFADLAITIALGIMVGWLLTKVSNRRRLKL